MASSAEGRRATSPVRPLRIGIVAGEASGDILGAGLIHAIKAQYPDAVFEGIAGPLMQAAGCHTRWPMEKLSVMGLIEVLRHLPELLSIRARLVQYFLDNPPDLYIGVDAPDFNFGVEAALHRTGIPTAHYVSPSVWAWREYRVKKIARSVDLMLTLFPFEVDFYARHGVRAEFVGHPLADIIDTTVDQSAVRNKLGLCPTGRLVALLPGSRRSEVERLLRPFLAAAAWCLEQEPSLRFILPAATPRLRVLIEQELRQWPADFPLTLLDGQAREAMAAADAVLLASGTAALEAMLLKRPMVVAYRLAPLTYWLARWLLRTPYYSLPNYLVGRKVVPELTQDAVTGENLGQAIMEQLRGNRREELTGLFTAVHLQLRRDASIAAAAAVLSLIRSTAHD